MTVTATTGDGPLLVEGTWTPTATQLLRFSALTWNSHLIHTSREHAVAYGLDDVVVHAQLHACAITRICLAGLGPGWRLTGVTWTNRAPAVVGQPLRVTGRVEHSADGRRAEIAVHEERPDGARCVEGRMTVTTDDPHREADR